MKRLLITTALLLITAALLLPAVCAVIAEEFDPHVGMTNLIETKWNHKDAIRFNPTVEPLATIRAKLDVMQYTLARPNANANRAVISHIVPIAGEPVRPGEPYTFGWLEDWQMERFQSGGSTSYYSLTNSSQVKIFRNHLPPVKDDAGNVLKPESYVIWMSSDERESLSFAKVFSQLQWVGFGGDAIKVHGNLDCDVRNMKFREDHLAPWNEMITTKNDVKYLTVKLSDGKKYGLKLEPLE